MFDQLSIFPSFDLTTEMRREKGMCGLGVKTILFSIFSFCLQVEHARSNPDSSSFLVALAKTDGYTTVYLVFIYLLAFSRPLLNIIYTRWEKNYAGSCGCTTLTKTV